MKILSYLRIAFVATILLIVPTVASAFQFEPLPGVEGFDNPLQQSLEAAYLARDPAEEFRTKYLQSNGQPTYINRLILEQSPYLRQHAHNPVNWYPWGAEAFEVARAKKLPLLLSIGYSTCHWCHVMEHETFDNVEMAEWINKTVIPVKIDREIRPDLDEIYITAVQVMVNYGGWPLNVFVTPDGDPFYGGVYFPPDQFRALLSRVETAWNTRREELFQISKQISAIVKDYSLAPGEEVEMGNEVIQQFVAAIAEYQKSIENHETTGNRFPRESELFLLLDEAVRNNKQALEVAEYRLISMALGGIRDHIGGGFHRYSVDTEWLVPHFEKMLYNQAHIGRAYLHAYWVTGKPFYRRVATQTLDYVLRELTDSTGIFYSATDADSEGQEGEFFLWTKDEIDDLFNEEDSALITDFYGVTDRGNFEGKNILYLEAMPENYADARGMDNQVLLNRLERIRLRMLDERNRREKPFLDKKAIVSWNSMMISTLAEAYQVLGDTQYLQVAEKASEFLWNHNRKNHGGLLRINLNGKPSVPGKLEDYAYFLEANLKLYDATRQSKWLERSKLLATDMLDKFWDTQNGGLFTVAKEDSEGLIVRQKDHYDDAIPSGNSVAAKALAMLYRRTGNPLYEARAEQILATFSAEYAMFPTNFAYALSALQDLRFGQLGSFEFAAAGHALVSVSDIKFNEDRLQAVIVAELDDGWHINSSKPLAENLVATTVSVDPDSGWNLADATFPEGELIETSFQSTPLSTYSGIVSIPIELEGTGNSSDIPVVVVTLQACNDELCLLPETLRLEILNHFEAKDSADLSS